MGDYRSTKAYNGLSRPMWHLENDGVSDSSDESPSRNSVGYLITDDADQQFWGDNELDSTSLSDIDGGSAKRLQRHLPSLSRLSVVPTADISGLRMTDSANNRAQKDKKVKYSIEQQLASTSITSDPILYQQSISTMSTQLSNLTRNQQGVGSRTRIRACAPIRARYHAAKRTREAEIYSLKASSSSDSDSPMERPVRKRRRSFCIMSDTDDQVTTLPGDKCPNCNIRPKNAIIVHGKIGHQCFCYQCSMKLMRANGKCAMCNRNIRKVVKNVVVKEPEKGVNAMVVS